MIDLLVQNPTAIAVIAGIFFVAYLVVHRALGHAQAGWLLLPGAAWALWALWELNIVLYSPEADIRVDLLAIVPLVLFVSIFGLIMLFMPHKPSAPAKRRAGKRHQTR